MSAGRRSRTAGLIRCKFHYPHTLVLFLNGPNPTRGRRGKQFKNLLLGCLSALPRQRGGADLQVGERPFKVQLEFKCGARYCTIGYLVRLRFSSLKRGERRDLLSIDK